MYEIGRPLDPWQAYRIVDAHGVQEDGLWAAFETFLSVARQNGKGGFTEAIELGGVFLFKEPLILHSAHQFKTSTAAFRRLVDIIDGSNWLTKRVKMVSRSKGDESIQLTPAAGGGIIQFVARTLGSGRGLTGSTTVFDESAYLTIGQYAAQTPALTTIPNPRIVYTGTPPDEDVGPMPEDAMMPSVRRRGQSGGDRVLYAEWSPGPDDDPTSDETAYKCNPALGIRIALWFLNKQLKNFTEAGKPQKYVTEHTGAWPPGEDEQWLVIPEAAWETAGDPNSKAEGGVALGISMREDRLATYIGFCGRRADGDRHVSLKERIEGSAQVVPTVQALMAEREGGICVVVIGAGDPARSLLPDFKAAGIDVITPSSADVAAECGAVHDAIAGSGEDVVLDLHHPCNPVLDAAMAAAAKKAVGKMWVWAGPNSAPLYAITNAAYGFRVCPPDDYDVLDSVF